jgi:exonuclease SbcD
MLHTSDWHLGRNFGPESLQADQEAFVEWVLDVVAAESVELVVIAGDLFDRAIPPVEAVSLLRHALTSLAARRVRVVAIAGNHDSAERVAAADGLTDAAGVIVRGGYAQAGATVTMEFADGPLDVVAVPFLDPLLDPAYTAAADGERPGHQSVLSVALARHRPTAPRSVAVAHAFVAGGAESDSERALTVGSSPRVATSTFDGFSYVALGHLHKPQMLGDPTRRYSGSPIPYSFSERHDKHVVLVDLDAAGGARTTGLVVPVGRPVATLSGDIDDLLVSPRHATHEQHFVRAVLTDRAHVVDAKARLRRRFPFVTEIVLQPPEPPDSYDAPRAAGRGALDPLEAACSFWTDVTGGAPDAEERRLLADLLDRARLAEAAR